MTGPGKRAGVVLAAIALSVGRCAPSITPAAKADIDRRIAELRPPAKSFDAPPEATGVPLEPGQWVQYRVRDDEGRPSFVTHKVVGEESGAFWMEVVTESYAGREVVKLLVGLGELRAPHHLPRNAKGGEKGTAAEKLAHALSHKHIELRALLLKNNAGDVTNVPPFFLRVVAFTWPYGFSLAFPDWQTGVRDEASVPAGRFLGCFMIRSTDPGTGEVGESSLSWFHPAVPLAGLVRRRSLDGAALRELVAFGTSGARSEL